MNLNSPILEIKDLRARINNNEILHELEYHYWPNEAVWIFRNNN